VEIIYGYAYQSAPLFLAIYCLLYLLVGFGYLVLPSLYNGLGETKTTLKMSLITFVTLVLMSPIFTKAYNVQGLIVALLIDNFCGTIYGLYTARKNFKITFETSVLLKIYINSAVGGIPAKTRKSTPKLEKIFNLSRKLFSNYKLLKAEVGNAPQHLVILKELCA